MTTQINQNHNGDDVSIRMQGLLKYDGVIHKFDKIIVVIFHSGLTKWYPFTLENMESIVWDFHNIEDIQIIEKGE